MPSAIKVGPFRYRVLMDAQKLRASERKNGDAADSQMGHVRHADLEIVIDPTVAPDQKAETLWHEVKHAIANLSAADGKFDEEQWIGRMSPMELAVLRENPVLVAFLTAEDGA